MDISLESFIVTESDESKVKRSLFDRIKKIVLKIIRKISVLCEKLENAITELIQKIDEKRAVSAIKKILSIDSRRLSIIKNCNVRIRKMYSEYLNPKNIAATLKKSTDIYGIVFDMIDDINSDKTDKNEELIKSSIDKINAWMKGIGIDADIKTLTGADVVELRSSMSKVEPDKGGMISSTALLKGNVMTLEKAMELPEYKDVLTDDKFLGTVRKVMHQHTYEESAVTKKIQSYFSDTANRPLRHVQASSVKDKYGRRTDDHVFDASTRDFSNMASTVTSLFEMIGRVVDFYVSTMHDYITEVVRLRNSIIVAYNRYVNDNKYDVAKQSGDLTEFRIDIKTSKPTFVDKNGDTVEEDRDT